MMTIFEVLYSELPTLISDEAYRVSEQMLNAMSVTKRFNDNQAPTHKVYELPYSSINKQHILGSCDGTVIEAYNYPMFGIMTVSDFETKFVPTQIATKTVIIGEDPNNINPITGEPMPITEEQPILWSEFVPSISLRYSNDNLNVSFSMKKNFDSNGNGNGLIGSELGLVSRECLYMQLLDTDEYTALLLTPEWYVKPPQMPQ